MRRASIASILILAAVSLKGSADAQILETETARQLRSGQIELGAGYEFQHSKDGNEIAIPIAFELGLTNRLGLLVEPVLYTAIRPESGISATGPGDLEITMSYLVRREAPRFPALALAAEEKIPTARNNLIGTGKADHTAYVIASKMIGRFDSHLNAGYTIVGSPKGQALQNRVTGAIATEFSVTPRTLLYGEVLGSTSTGGEGDAGGTTSPVPEASGDEFFGTLGVARSFGRGTLFSLGVTRDNVGAMQVRPGVTLWFR